MRAAQIGEGGELVVEDRKLSDTLEEWNVFQQNVAMRLAQGHRDYGEASFDRPVGELVREIEEELLDVAGWSFILWCRLQKLAEVLK